MNETKRYVPRKGYKEEWVIDINRGDALEIIAWCTEHFGKPGRNRKYHWRAAWTTIRPNVYLELNPRIFLRRGADVTMFMLRWVNNGHR